MATTSFDHIRGLIEGWGHERRITSNGTVKGQLQKTIEEAQEGIDACDKLGDRPVDPIDNPDDELLDALGDIGVTWLMACRTAGQDPVDMLYLAHEEIKDRTGHLGTDGIFHKDA